MKRVILGRYDDCGEWEGPRFLWQQSEGHWYEWPHGSGKRKWAVDKPSKFYRGEPTHWRPLLEPPPPPDAPTTEPAP